MLAHPTSSRTRGAFWYFPSDSWQLSSTCTTSCSPKTRRMPATSASSLVAVLQSSLSPNLATSSTPGRPSTSPGSPDDLQTHPDATWYFPDLRSLFTYAGSSSSHEQEGYATCSWSVAAARGNSAHAVAARLGYPPSILQSLAGATVLMCLLPVSTKTSCCTSRHGSPGLCLPTTHHNCLQRSIRRVRFCDPCFRSHGLKRALFSDS